MLGISRAKEEVKDAFATLRGALIALCAAIVAGALMITAALVVTA